MILALHGRYFSRALPGFVISIDTNSLQALTVQLCLICRSFFRKEKDRLDSGLKLMNPG